MTNQTIQIIWFQTDQAVPSKELQEKGFKRNEFLHCFRHSNVWKTNEVRVNKAINQVNQMKVWNNCHNEMVYWRRMELANRARLSSGDCSVESGPECRMLKTFN